MPVSEQVQMVVRFSSVPFFFYIMQEKICSSDASSIFEWNGATRGHFDVWIKSRELLHCLWPWGLGVRDFDSDSPTD